MFAIVGDFLLDKWLWSITWGWYQILLAPIFMWMLMVLIGWMKGVSALVLTVTSYVFTFVIYSAFIVCLFVYFFEWEYVSHSTGYVPLNPLRASLGLAIVYSIIQSCFFCLVNRWYRLALIRILLITVMSNIGAALLATFFTNVPG